MSAVDKLKVIPFALLIGVLVLGAGPQFIWPELKESAEYRGAMFVIIAAVVGAYGNLYGGILGAEINFTRQKEKERLNARKLLLAQLKFTYDQFSTINPNIKVHIGCVIWDRNWATYLPYLEELSEQEIRQVVNWFYCMEQIHATAQANNCIVQSNHIIQLLSTPIQPIPNIISKLSIAE